MRSDFITVPSQNYWNIYLSFGPFAQKWFEKIIGNVRQIKLMETTIEKVLDQFSWWIILDIHINPIYPEWNMHVGICFVVAVEK